MAEEDDGMNEEQRGDGGNFRGEFGLRRIEGKVGKVWRTGMGPVVCFPRVAAIPVSGCVANRKAEIRAFPEGGGEGGSAILGERKRRREMEQRVSSGQGKSGGEDFEVRAMFIWGG